MDGGGACDVQSGRPSHCRTPSSSVAPGLVASPPPCTNLMASRRQYRSLHESTRAKHRHGGSSSVVRAARKPSRSCEEGGYAPSETHTLSTSTKMYPDAYDCHVNVCPPPRLGAAPRRLGAAPSLWKAARTTAGSPMALGQLRGCTHRREALFSGLPTRRTVGLVWLAVTAAARQPRAGALMFPGCHRLAGQDQSRGDLPADWFSLASHQLRSQMRPTRGTSSCRGCPKRGHVTVIHAADSHAANVVHVVFHLSTIRQETCTSATAGCMRVSRMTADHALELR